ncbi:uncharacterized protein TNCV_4298811 [Trichonephila clavipes]|nr:uncharacterized protein TNCV_4298811 [Trichonephila clavipes]
MTISRLELLSCTIGARLSKAVKEDLEFDESIPVYYWSDSSNVLYWIKKNENWDVYVFNGVQEIRKLINPAEWRHISGSLNPADLPSRGCNIEKMSRSRCDESHFWLNVYVNKQNCRIWSEANPQVYVETPLHPEKMTVWCALWAGGILLQKR